MVAGIKTDPLQAPIQTVPPQIMQRATGPYNDFAGLNNNDLQTVNANLSNNALDGGVTGFTDRDEEYPFDLEMDGGNGSQDLVSPVTEISAVPTQYVPAGQGCVLNSVTLNSCIGLSGNQTGINSVPNFTFTTPTQSAMYSPPLMSSNHGYQFQRATPQTFSPTACTPWQHSVPNRVPWIGQTIGLTVSAQGVSIFTAPLGSRANISWTNTSPQVTTLQNPSPSCSQIPRRPKRASSENMEYLSPTNKIHLTEKMIADHMQELSINKISIPSASDGIQPFSTDFIPVQRAREPVKSRSSPFVNQKTLPDIARRGLSHDIQWQAFRDLEERLDISDDESVSKKESKYSKLAPKVVFLEDIPKQPQNDVIPQKILEAIQKPSPSYELVLWQPPADVVKDTIDRVTAREKDSKQSQELQNEFDSKEDESTMDLDLCEGEDMML